MNLNSPEAVLYPECVLLSTKNYILDSITMKMSSDLSQFEAPTSNVGDKEAELVAKLFESSNLSLRMYGSSEELAENVKIYRSSPGSGVYADANGHPMYPYYTTPVIYRSLKDEQYLCKSDAYVVLQNLTLEVYPFEKPQLLRVILALFLRSQELKNLRRVEFLKFDEHDFVSIKKEIEVEMKAFGTNNFTRFKNLLKIDWGVSEAALFERILGNYFLEFHAAPNFAYLLTILYSTAERIIRLLQKIIDNRLEVFLLGGPRPTVRLFEDHGGQRFVMEAELFNAINKSIKETNFFDEMFIEAMTLEDVQKKFGDQIRDIEFIRYPIHRAKDRAVPIQSPLNNKLFCVPTVDAFFDFMKNLILSVQLFQKLPSWNMAEQMLLGCELGFKSEEKNPYFTMSTHLNTIKATYFATPLPHTAKEIRNAKNDGFTVQNLKNELAHLGLTTIFPEIQNHAELVYSEVDKRKKGSVLRTCDLFDAVEHCQLNCILERRPTFKKFLHNQNGCHRIYGFKCQECEREKRTSEIWKTFEPIDAATEDTMSPEGKKSSEQLSTVSQKSPEAHQKTIENLKITKETSESASGDVKTSESQKKSPETSPSLQILQEHKVTQKESDEEIQKKSAEIEELKRKVEENLKIAEENEKLVSEAAHLIDTIAELKEEHSKYHAQ
ncbi:Protein CBG04306 [Caenorhabditis briggsae]|uniref:Protein CBG04306 n=1 Tax=Caenorhabditis briggsae TaxID=6238 RepID=A8WX73_CAEBR|nr:Protein CBG04306 [Caenorhabditis briggsae]CAP25040.1 Protein CBG04306 [Caenorhabditis briggsae]